MDLMEHCLYNNIISKVWSSIKWIWTKSPFSSLDVSQFSNRLVILYQSWETQIWYYITFWGALNLGLMSILKAQCTSFRNILDQIWTAKKGKITEISDYQLTRGSLAEIGGLQYKQRWNCLHHWLLRRHYKSHVCSD